MFRLLLITLLFSGANIYGQVLNVAGDWHGTSNWLSLNSITSMNLEQDGEKITGVVSLYLKDSSKYAKYQVRGLMKENKVTLTGLKFIEKKGTWCLPVIVMSVIEINGQMLMEGRWKPNLRWGGCTVGLSGRISVVKDIPQQVITITSTTSSTNQESQDAYTKDLISGLSKRKYHALIIGINEYNDQSLTDLDQPIEDGEKLRQVLTGYYNFKPEQITQLKNPTRTEILNHLEDLSENLGELDNLLVFYAGHGIWDEKLEQGYWLPSNASLDSKAQWISNATIRDYIRAIKSKHTLLIADACFSGGLLKERSVGKAMANMYNLPSRKAITSGTLTTVPDKSVFMEYLIKYLIQNQDPLISADQIFYQMKIAVINNSPNSQVPQYGPIHMANDEGGEFVFLRAPVNKE